MYFANFYVSILNIFTDGVEKEFVVKSYVNASFNLDDSKSQSGYILKVGAIS